MSAADSNLSAPAYGYDLVCAITEAGLNATMLQMLSKQNEEVAVHYGYDATNKLVQLTSDQIQAIVTAAGIDPFMIPDQTPSTDPKFGPALAALNAAGFAYAFRAKLGLPAGIAPSLMPDVIQLNQGNSQVSYQLFCAEFAVIELNYLPRGQYGFTNLTQPADAPWLFRFMVNMDLAEGAPTPFNQLPPAAQQQIKNVDPRTMFSVQQLLLDVSSRALEGAVSIPGLDPSSPAYLALTQVFIDTYWDKMAPTNYITVGFAATPQTTVAVTGPSIVPTDLAFEVDPYVDTSGTGVEGLNTLNYLTVVNNQTLPVAVPFSWNWVDPADEISCHGVMAVRRGVFANFLASLLNPRTGPLCVATNIYLSHDGEKLFMELNAPPSPNPASWNPVATSVVGPDGWTPLLTINASYPCSDSASTWTGGGKETGEFNYTLAGDFSTKGAQLRLTINGQAYLDWHYYLLGIDTANFSGNVVNLTLTATYTLGVLNGGLTVTPTAAPAVADNSEDINVSWWDKFIQLGNDVDKIETARTNLNASLIAATMGLAAQVQELLNGTAGWIYPGGQTFLFHDVAFSNEQDLVVRVVYADPEQPATAAVTASAPVTA